MIQAESDPQKRDEYLQRLMELPNQVRLITRSAGRDTQYRYDTIRIRRHGLLEKSRILMRLGIH